MDFQVYVVDKECMVAELPEEIAWFRGYMECQHQH